MTTEQRSVSGPSFFRRIGMLLTGIQRRLDRLKVLENRIESLEANHNASVDWLQKTYPEIVGAIGLKLEKSHLDQLAQDLFSAIHRETGMLNDRLGIIEQNDPLARTKTTHSENKEDSRSKAFYLELERCFRGTEEEIADRVSYYLPLLEAEREAHNPVLDVGCGRGEWLGVVTQRGFTASGVDLNPINGDYCRSKQLSVSTNDALNHLASIASDSVGTVSAFHLVEHLPFSDLLSLTDEILRILKPGGLLIYETPNPENLLVATHSFWIDPTHVRPIPPVLLEFLVRQRGFIDCSVHRLHPDDSQTSTDETLRTLLRCPRDFAIVAHKPRPA